MKAQARAVEQIEQIDPRQDEEETIGQKPARRRVEKSDVAFRTIGEAAEELSLKTHVLRFWETKFNQLSPMKRKDGRRFYRPEDMLVLRALQHLLHEQGMTIKGAQRVLKSQNAIDILDGETSALSETVATRSVAGKSVRDLQEAVQTAVDSGAFRGVEDTPQDGAPRERLNRLLDDLVDLKGRLDAVRKTS